MADRLAVARARRERRLADLGRDGDFLQPQAMDEVIEYLLGLVERSDSLRPEPLILLRANAWTVSKRTKGEK